MTVPATPAATPDTAPADVSPPNAIRIGYARVSTRAQDHQLQMDALAGAHCREIVEETASTRRERPKLAATINRMHPGDTLVVYKPDRIARSVKELLVLLEDELAPRGINLHILSGVCAGLHRPGGQSVADKMLFLVAALAAEMERDLIRERTRDGLAAAAAQGRKGGRPPALDEDKLAAARARRARGESIPAIAKAIGVGRSTLYRALENDPIPIPAARTPDQTAPAAAPMAAPAEQASAEHDERGDEQPPARPHRPAAPPAAQEDQEDQEQAETSPWERWGDPMQRRTWYSDAELAAVRLVPTGSVDGSAWVVVAGDVFGTVAPALSARGTRSGWTARHRTGTAAWHLGRGTGGGTRPATRTAAVADLIADVHHAWREQRRTTPTHQAGDEGRYADVITYALHRGLRPEVRAEILGELSPAEREEVEAALDRHRRHLATQDGDT